MKIIGHRGAAGLALENTLEAIHAAIGAGVDAVEIDLRITADSQFVLCHDVTTKRISKTKLTVSEHTADELSNVVLHNGAHLANLSPALEIVNKHPLLLDVKGSDWAEALAGMLRKYTSRQIIVIATDHQELTKFHALLPKLKTYAVIKFVSTDWLETIRGAAKRGFTGVDMNFWLLNPLTYRVARRSKLEVIVYTVNHGWIAHFMQRLFPGIMFTTNHPRRLRFLKLKAQPA